MNNINLSIAEEQQKRTVRIQQRMFTLWHKLEDDGRYVDANIILAAQLLIGELTGIYPPDLKIDMSDYKQPVQSALVSSLLTVLAETELERKSSKNTKKRLEEWIPPKKYWMYLSELKAFVKANPNAGTLSWLAELMDPDEDEDRIIAGIVELRRDPLTETAAIGLIDALYEWEHVEKLMKILAQLWPQEYDDEFEEHD